MVLDKVIHTINKYNLINSSDKIVIGVSGGPDSVTLLYLLSQLKKELKLQLHVAHLDHKLRKDSWKDSDFTKSLSLKLNIPFTTAKINIKALAQKGSVEEIARNTRLDFLLKVAKNIGANKIALGHNFDDQAETVMMRILRGTGLYGLAGILPKRKLYGFTIVRPLIEITRKEIDGFLRRRKIKPCIDRSNSDYIYFRNRVRHRLIPLLESEYNKNIKTVLSNFAQSVGADYDYLQQAARLALKIHKNAINLSRFKKLHPAMQRIILRNLIANIKGNTRRITFQHILEIEDLILNRPQNSIVDLPGGIYITKQKNRLSFQKKTQ